MLNRLTQLANLIGNLNIVKTFQNRHGNNTASAVAKRYNDEQDLIRNEMGKIGNASDEYRQLAALLRESEQEEQKTVTALTYDGESDDFKDSSLKADSAVEKLNSFSGKDSNLATLLNARTGIIQNIVAKQNELNNATDNSQAEQIKAEIEKLYDEKSKAEEDIYDYIKDNPTYENVAGDLKTAIDGANQAKGNNGAQTPATGKTPGSKPNTKPKGDEANKTFDFENVPDLGSIPVPDPNNKDKTIDVDLGNVDTLAENYSLSELDAMKNQLEEKRPTYESQEKEIADKRTTIGNHIEHFEDALSAAVGELSSLTGEIGDAVTNREEIKTNISTTEDNIQNNLKIISEQEQVAEDLNVKIANLTEPSKAAYYIPDGNGGYKFASEQYKTAHDTWQTNHDALVEQRDAAKEEAQKASDELKKNEETLKEQCNSLDEIELKIIELAGDEAQLNGYKEDIERRKDLGTNLADRFITAANDLKEAMNLNYAQQKQVDAAIQKKNEDMKKASDETAENYKKDTSENKQEKMAEAVAVAQALQYSQMTDDEKIAFRDLCIEAGYNDAQVNDDLGKDFLDYVRLKRLQENNQTDEQS